ncbi:hypothetical protein ACFVIY_21980 [Streptomyces sp. NPDC127166]|uniref:hypothetical protein n=1 Tax=Streptomyces sp. NPDC127166 TaxID=3345380 RepID=UPI0036378547
MSVEGIGAEPADTAPEGDATVGRCPTCQAHHSPAASPRPFVYALGQIELRFPNQGVEKELAQNISRADTAGLTDRQALNTVLNLPENRYLARQVCYVFTVQGDAYVLAPRDPATPQTTPCWPRPYAPTSRRPPSTAPSECALPSALRSPAAACRCPW